MTYLLKHKKIKVNDYKKVVKMAVFTIILSSVFYFWSGFFLPLFLKILVPVSTFSKKAGSNLEIALKLLEPKSTLISQNEILKRKLAMLEARIFDYEIIAGENVFLREKLEFLNHDFTIANLLLVPPQIPYDTILVDRGESNGVLAGAVVLIRDRAILGYVEESYDNFSRVRMYSSSGIKTSAILEKDGTIVELLGMGGGNFLLEAPLDFNIRKGDIFLMPGKNRLVVAIVGSVKKEKTSSFTKVLLKVPHKISGNSTLLVQVK